MSSTKTINNNLSLLMMYQGSSFSGIFSKTIGWCVRQGSSGKGYQWQPEKPQKETCRLTTEEIEMAVKTTCEKLPESGRLKIVKINTI